VADIKYLESPYVRWAADDARVADIQLPDGTKLSLTAEQVVSAVVTPHGNTGRSKITVAIAIDVEAQGTVEQYRQYFLRSLLETVRSKDAALSSIGLRLATVVADRDRLAADERARQVVESARIAAAGQPSR